MINVRLSGLSENFGVAIFMETVHVRNDQLYAVVVLTELDCLPRSYSGIKQFKIKIVPFGKCLSSQI